MCLFTRFCVHNVYVVVHIKFKDMKNKSTQIWFGFNKLIYGYKHKDLEK